MHVLHDLDPHLLMCIMFMKDPSNEFFLVPVTIADNFSLPMQGRGPTQVYIRSCIGRRHRLVLRKYMLIMCHTNGLTTQL